MRVFVGVWWILGVHGKYIQTLVTGRVSRRCPRWPSGAAQGGGVHVCIVTASSGQRAEMAPRAAVARAAVGDAQQHHASQTSRWISLQQLFGGGFSETISRAALMKGIVISSCWKRISSRIEISRSEGFLAPNGSCGLKAILILQSCIVQGDCCRVTWY